MKCYTPVATATEERVTELPWARVASSGKGVWRDGEDAPSVLALVKELDRLSGFLGRGEAGGAVPPRSPIGAASYVST